MNELAMMAEQMTDTIHGNSKLGGVNGASEC